MTQFKLTPRRGGLALVDYSAPAPAPRISFCSHCGISPDTQQDSRVCGSCGLGVLLGARSDVAPEPHGAFIVIDASLSVCAVSEGAERLLATCETDAVNRHVTELLVPADAEAQGPRNLAVAVSWAARDEEARSNVTVRPANTFGVRLSAWIASCGPPQAALLVFDTAPGR